MKNQKKQLIILCVLLAVCAAGYFLLADPKEKEGEDTEEAISLYLSAVSDITWLQYEYEGETLSFTMKDQWVCDQDDSVSIRQSNLEKMAVKLSNLEARDCIGKVEQPADYGLEEPVKKVKWTAAGETHEFYVGDYNMAGRVYYLYDLATEQVYTVDSQAVYGFTYTLQELTVSGES